MIMATTPRFASLENCHFFVFSLSLRPLRVVKVQKKT